MRFFNRPSAEMIQYRVFRKDLSVNEVEKLCATAHMLTLGSPMPEEMLLAKHLYKIAEDTLNQWEQYPSELG